MKDQNYKKATHTLKILFILLFFYSCGSSKRVQQTNADKQIIMNGVHDENPPLGTPPNGIPPGPPPNGGKPNMMPPGGTSEQFDCSKIKATFSFASGSEIKKNETVNASAENQSAFVTFKQAKVQLSGNEINTSGNTSSNDQSSFQGLNAAILGRDESTITMDHNTIKTTGIGANAIFAYGKSVIYTSNDIIDCAAGGAHGIMASGGGTIIANDVNMITRGKNSGAIATDRGSGTITVDGGKITTTGQDSPGIYSTGKITVSNAEITATGAEIAVIEGSNSIILNNSNLLCSFQKKWGVMIYQSFSGDAEGVDGHFEANGGSLNCTDKEGPMFFVTNSNANIFLNHVELQQASGILLKAEANRWGLEGSNGGKANLTACKQSMHGELNADKNSQIQLIMKDSSLFEGTINSSDKAQYIVVEMDTTSKWTLTKDSYVNRIKTPIEGEEVVNIIGNGHDIYYSKSDSPTLKGKTYHLKNGGTLKPQ